MANYISEDQIEKAIIEVFTHNLGYRHINCMENDTTGRHPMNSVAELQTEMRELKKYMDEVLTDQNDINDDTRTQLELINQTLAEMQANNNATNKPRRQIGFISHNEETTK